MRSRSARVTDVSETLQPFAVEEDGLVNWLPYAEMTRLDAHRDGQIRTQWCHGAPGIVATLGDMLDEELAVAGGELTWRAGPLRKGASLCHGTAGNGYAFLALLERTGDERWLARARAFAMHAAAQMEHSRSQDGRGRYSLWTGDLGTALYLADCIDGRGDATSPLARAKFGIARMGDALYPEMRKSLFGGESLSGTLRKGLRQMDTLRVLVADDHRLMLAAVRRALAEAEDFEIVGEVSVGSHVVPAVRETKPNVVLLDMRMPELDGLALPGAAPQARSHDRSRDPLQLQRRGADRGRAEGGCARVRRQDGRAGRSRRGPPERGLGQVVRGLGRRRSRRAPLRPEQPALSEREGVVLEAVARGLSNREIGRQLWISEQTVKFHLRNIYRKLGISSRTEAARYAYRTGVVGALTVESA